MNIGYEVHYPIMDELGNDPLFDEVRFSVWDEVSAKIYRRVYNEVISEVYVAEESIKNGYTMNIGKQVYNIVNLEVYMEVYNEVWNESFNKFSYDEHREERDEVWNEVLLSIKTYI